MIHKSKNDSTIDYDCVRAQTVLMAKPLTFALCHRWFDAFANGTEHQKWRRYGKRGNELDCPHGDEPAGAEVSDSVPTIAEDDGVNHVALSDDLIAPARGIVVSMLLGICLWALAGVIAWYLL